MCVRERERACVCVRACLRAHRLCVCGESGGVTEGRGKGSAAWGGGGGIAVSNPYCNTAIKRSKHSDSPATFPRKSKRCQ